MKPIFEYLRNEIARLQKEIVRQQEMCNHKNHVRTGHSDTGNWCKADDCYWYEFICHDCGKYWTETQ